MFSNGKFYKDPKVAMLEDFFFPKLLNRQNTSNRLGFIMTLVNVMNLITGA